MRMVMVLLMALALIADSARAAPSVTTIDADLTCNVLTTNAGPMARSRCFLRVGSTNTVAQATRQSSYAYCLVSDAITSRLADGTSRAFSLHFITDTNAPGLGGVGTNALDTFWLDLGGMGYNLQISNVVLTVRTDRGTNVYTIPSQTRLRHPLYMFVRQGGTNKVVDGTINLSGQL